MRAAEEWVEDNFIGVLTTVMTVTILQVASTTLDELGMGFSFFSKFDSLMYVYFFICMFCIALVYILLLLQSFLFFSCIKIFLFVNACV